MEGNDMKTNAELTLNDVLYSADAGGIRQYKIKKIELGIKVQVVNYSCSIQWYEGANNSDRLERTSAGDFPKFLYSNIESAQAAQLEARRYAIETSRKNMLAAQENYFKLVEAYKGTVADKEPINKLD